MNDNKVKIVELDLNDILPNRFQPRIKFNEESIIELSDSIKLHGVLQPIIVRPISDKYEIVVGERRYKAAVLADLTTIPARIVDLDDKASIEIALIENLQRRDLNPMEEAISYKKTLNMGYMTQEQLASKLGKSQSAIANKIRLLNLCDDVQEALMEEKISERHARSLLKVSSEKEQEKLLERIIKERITVRKLDEIINNSDFEKSESVDKDSDVDIDDKKINDNKEDINSNVDEIDNKKIENQKENKNTDIVSDETDKHDDELINESIDEQREVVVDDNIDKQDEEDNSFELKDFSSDNVIDLSNVFSAFEEELSNDSDEIIDDEEKDKNQSTDDDGIKDKEENDNMNNFQDIGTNSNSNISGGRFFNSNILNSVNDEGKQDSAPINDGFVVRGNEPSAPSTPSIFAGNVNMNNLLTPQSEISANSSSATSIFGDVDITADNNPTGVPTTQSMEKSIPSLLESNTNTQPSMFSNLMTNGTNNEQIDKNTLNNFLDPTFIDGQKQDLNNSSSSIDEQVFAKFIDPDYGGEVKSTSESDSNNAVDLNTLLASSSQNTQLNSSNESLQVTNESNPVSPIDLTNNTSQIDLFKPETKPDLLAPMGNDEVVSVPTQNVIESPVSNAQTQDSSPFAQIMNQINSNPGAVSQAASISDNFIPIAQNQPELTLDDSINTFEKTEEKVSQDVAPEVSSSPIFVTSSTPVESVAPVSPIIDNPSISKLLMPEGSVNTEINQSESVPTEPIQNAAPISNINNNVNDVMETQPIIITDYTKQYDPILPQDMTNTAPKIEFKDILNMIRDLNDKIESLGYTIDTEEIDLKDVYQVIFNISKL